MKLRRKSPTAEAVQWDGSETTLVCLRSAGLPWSSHSAHIDRPGEIQDLRIRPTPAPFDRETTVVVEVTDWIVREEDGTGAGRWYVFKTPDELLAVYEVAP